eukprot:103639_1
MTVCIDHYSNNILQDTTKLVVNKPINKHVKINSKVQIYSPSYNSEYKWFNGKIKKINVSQITVEYVHNNEIKNTTLPPDHWRIKIIENRKRIRESEDTDVKPTLSNKRRRLNKRQSSTEYKLTSKSSYYKHDKILFIGEMDFSLSSCIAKQIGGKNIISTAYYKKLNEIKCSNDAKDNISELKQNNATVCLNIDGTKLEQYDFKLEHNGEIIQLFDKILFAFPYSTNANGKTKKEINKIFMEKIFSS